MGAVLVGFSAYRIIRSVRVHDQLRELRGFSRRNVVVEMWGGLLQGFLGCLYTFGAGTFYCVLHVLRIRAGDPLSEFWIPGKLMN
jgi:hypothetical protein